MKFISTRNSTPSFSLDMALLAGLAPDGGLFVPETLPQINRADFNPAMPFAAFASQLLHPFFASSQLENALPAICERAFNFTIPLTQVDASTWELELFHGPTLSFKDVGARFLAECLSLLSNQKPITLLVATSGDTGSAVAAAFYQKPGVTAVILYPEGQISKRQAHQINCWGENILSLAVKGSFDDCQHLVKSAFADPNWKDMGLCTANSVNIGRLLPQMSYYAYTSLQFYLAHQQPAGFIIPTGNLGNATAAYWAKAMGFPIREIVLATNANQVISDYLVTGDFKPRASINTLANAMDVGKPSNFERLQYLFPSWPHFKQEANTFSVSDEAIKETIKENYKIHQRFICPHTATAYNTRKQLSSEPWINVATAHPCKFDDIIKPLLNQVPPIPLAMEKLLARPCHERVVENDLNAIKRMKMMH
ncbi:MAG: threonine synthase [Legionellales bacterium]|nr:threonine synthase [Legionellales bacterium]